MGSNIQKAIRPTLDKAQSALEHELSNVTIADIAAERRVAARMNL